MSDKRLTNLQVGDLFSFPESRFPAARFWLAGPGSFIQEIPPYGYVGYPEIQFELYEGPVYVHSAGVKHASN